MEYVDEVIKTDNVKEVNKQDNNNENAGKEVTEGV